MCAGVCCRQGLAFSQSWRPDNTHTAGVEGMSYTPVTSLTRGCEGSVGARDPPCPPCLTARRSVRHLQGQTPDQRSRLCNPVDEKLMISAVRHVYKEDNGRNCIEQWFSSCGGMTFISTLNWSLGNEFIKFTEHTSIYLYSEEHFVSIVWKPVSVSLGIVPLYISQIWYQQIKVS